MTVSYHHTTGLLPGAASEGILVRGQQVQNFIYVDSDLGNETAETITMSDLLTGLEALDSNQTWLQEILPGFTYVLRTFVLFRRNITLDLRNTNVDILSSGAGITNGAGIVFRAFGPTATTVLTGGARARCITGNTLIIVRNRDEQQRIYGPFNRNSAWLNRGGNTTILVDAGPKYDWSCNETGTNDMTPDMFGIYDFEEGYRIGVVGVGQNRADAHLFINPASNPRNFEVRDASPGGSISAATTVPFTAFFFGGRFDNFIFGGLLTGPVANKRAGLAAGDDGLTVEMRSVRSSNRTLTCNRREAFFDILGIIGTQVDDIVVATNSVNAVAMQYIGDTALARPNYRGLFRLAYAWKPRFIATDGEALKHNNDSIHFDVRLGTVTAHDMPGGVTSPTPPFMESGDGFGATLSATDGSISWTDPWTRSRPETGRNDRVRDHVRLPWAWTQHMGHTYNLGYFRCSSANWHLFIAGYLPPRSAQALNYPFINWAYGNEERDIVVSYDEAFGSTGAAVLTARTAAKDDYETGHSGNSLNIYRMVMWALEVTNANANDAWSDFADLLPSFGGGIVNMGNSAAQIRFNQVSLTEGVELDPAQNRVDVKALAVAGQSYEAGASILFNSPIPNCTIGTSQITGVVDAANPINGLRLLKNCTLFVTHNTDVTITVNGITGHTLFIENSGTGTVTVLTDTPNHITPLDGVVLAVQISVTGMVAGPASFPSRLTLYRVKSDDDVDPATETSVTGNTSHVFGGLTHGGTYRLVWSCPSYQTVYRQIDSLAYGQVDVVIEPQLTPFAQGVGDVVAGTMVVTQWQEGPGRLRFSIDAKRTVDGTTFYVLNGTETNALFETAKSTLEFTRAIAELKHTRIIAHPSAQETSLLLNEHQIIGDNDGDFRHTLQGVLVHEAAGELTTEAPNVRTQTLTGASDPLPEVIIYPSVVPLTFSEGARLIDGISGGGGGDEVTVDGLTADGKNAIIEAIHESGAV